MIMGRPAPVSGHRGVSTLTRNASSRRYAWPGGDAYAICFDDAIIEGGARWRAWRLGGGTAITGSTPEKLNTAIWADWGAA
jgi:hypothetical protein